MKTVIAAILSVALFTVADNKIKLKEIAIDVDGIVEIAKLSEENLKGTCVLPDNEEPYAVIHGGKITGKNIFWHASVLGKNKSDLLVFIAIYFVKDKNSTSIQNYTFIWEDGQWLGYKDYNENVADFVKKHFTEKEFTELYQCVFDEQKTDPRQEAVLNNSRIQYLSSVKLDRAFC